MEAISLEDTVVVQLIDNDKIQKIEGVIVGRTIQSNPTYDVVLKNGNTLINIDAKRIERI